MQNRRFEEIPATLREGWEPTEAGKAWGELLGPHVPQDVRRWTPCTDSGFLLSDPHALLAAPNSFAAAIEGAFSAGVVAPVLQVLTNTYFLAEIPHEGDCLMFFCPRGSETAEVVAWNHETSELYGPLAYDLPTVLRLLDVSDSGDETEARQRALNPALGRWELDTFPMSLFEDALEDDGVWSRGDGWPEVAAPKSIFPNLVNRAWWVALALVDARADTDHIKAQLEWTPHKAFAKDDFQDLPYSALYWLWRSYFLGEEEWHQEALERCKESQSRLVRDAAAYAQAEGGRGALAAWRRRGMQIVEQAGNPFPARLELGPVAFVRDDTLATLEAPAPKVPRFECEKGQPGNPWWPEKARVAAPHPDGKRWLVEGQREHPRKGKHPSIPNRIDALFEVDPETGLGSLFADTQGEGSHTKWAQYLDENRLLLINNGRLRLYERRPEGSGLGYLIDSVPLGQERAVVLKELGFIAGYGGIPRLLDGGWKTVPERISGARLVDGRLQRTANIELALSYLAVKGDQLVGRSEDGTAGYRVEGLPATAQPESIVLLRTAFAKPEKVWRAGPAAVLDALGPMDVSVETADGLCLINKLVTDPPGARRAYVGNAQGIRPTTPELAIANYAIISPKLACVGTKTAAYRVSLESSEAVKLFDYPEGSGLEVLQDGFAVLSAGELQVYSTVGEALTRVRVGDGGELLAPIHDNRVLALKARSSPLVLLALEGGSLRLLGAVRPESDAGKLSFSALAHPQWLYRVLGTASDGSLFEPVGIQAALANTGSAVVLDEALPERPWEAGPEISLR